MDDDKNVIEKLVDKISPAVENITKPEPVKPGEQVVMLPSVGNGLFGEPPMPAFVIIPRPRKSRAKSAIAKKAGKKSAKKSAKKKKAAKPWKPATEPKIVVKTKAGKKTAKKKRGKKSRR
jgi:hypothetical protein